MKKKLISTLIILSAINITIPASAIDVIESAVQPEPSGAPVVEEKISVWSKFKERTINFFKKDSETAEDKIENVTVAEIEDKTQTIVEKQKKTVEIKSIAQIQEEQKNKSRKERRADKNAEEDMTVKQRQEALADRISDDVLSEETIDSTVIKGGVEENVIVSIDDCVKLGLYNNPTIRYAISNSDIYKSKIAQAWANYFPEFSVGTAFSKNKMLPVNFKFPMMKYDLWNALAVDGSILLYDFGKTGQQVKIAKRAHEASVSDIQSAINETIYNVKSAYYQYLFTLRQQQVLQSTVDKFNTHYMEAKAAYDVGMKAKIDVITAEYNLSNAKLDLIKAQNQVATAQAQLNNTMGLPAYSNYSVSDKLDINEYDLQFENLIEKAYELRPELQSVALKTEASKMLVTSSKLAFAPDLKGFGNYTVGGREYAGEYGYQYGLRLSYPVSNFMRLKQQVNEAKATYERDLAQLEQQQNNVYLDVKTAYLSFVNARDGVPVAKQAMEQAQIQYEIAAGRYRTGLSDAIELKDAEITYRNAQLNYYNTLMQYNTAVASVEKTVGMPIKPSGVNEEISIPVDVNEEEINL